jgi:hypothetical protein
MKKCLKIKVDFNDFLIPNLELGNEEVEKRDRHLF